MSRPALFHFTCSHTAESIGDEGLLVPNRKAVDVGIAPVAIVWATDLAEPDPVALGLQSEVIACDRTEFRYEILRPERFVPWLASAARGMYHLADVRLLELERQPERWWVSAWRVPARLSPIGVSA